VPQFAGWEATPRESQGAQIGRVMDAIILGRTADCLLYASTVHSTLGIISLYGSARIRNSEILVA
jgi:hypothetical protein